MHFCHTHVALLHLFSPRKNTGCLLFVAVEVLSVVILMRTASKHGSIFSIKGPLEMLKSTYTFISTESETFVSDISDMFDRLMRNLLKAAELE